MTSSSSRLDLIQIDTREKKNSHLEQYLNSCNLPFIRSKMYVGDYQLISNPFYVIDRKQNLSELYSNVTTQHKRFQNELKKANEFNIHVVVLVEEDSISCLEDVKTWKNPQRQYSKKALTGERLFKMLDTITLRYDCEILFCPRDQYAETVVTLLRDAQSKWLNGIAAVYRSNDYE